MSQLPQPTADPVGDQRVDDEGASMKAAFGMRANGCTRAEVIGHLVAHGHAADKAEVLLNHYDRTSVKLGRAVPQDIAPEVLQRLGPQEETPQPVAAPIVEAVEPTSEPVAPAAAAGTRTAPGLNAAQRHFDNARNAAIRSAQWRIVLGLFTFALGVALMVASVEFGRRSPLGAAIGGGVLLVNGLKALLDANKLTNEPVPQIVTF